MQYVNDDMDDVFRRAANDYPLNTASADWSKMAKALDIEEEAPKRKKDKRHLAWLLLLLPLPWLCTNYIGNGEKDAVATNKAVSDAKHLKTSYQSDNSVGFETPVNESSNVDQLTATTSSVNNTIVKDKTPHLKEGLITKRDAFTISNKLNRKATSTNSKSTASISSEETSSLQSQAPATEQSSSLSYPPVNLAASAKASDEVASVNDVVKDNRQDSVVVNVKKTAKPKSRKFYAGFIGGADVTTIKGQKIKNIDLNAGILIGYNLSRRWSVEASALSARKNYYSSGEYLNTSKIYLPANSKITYVNGECRMIELSGGMKYNFSFTKKGNWFATAGITSYLMKQEDYDYEYYYANSNYSAIHSKTYKNESKDWAAVGQVSAGYSLTLKRNFTFRAAPYVQIALKGMGYGKLPLSSAGVQVGITKSLF